MKEVEWFPTVYCRAPFQPTLAYVNHIIALFAGRLKGNIRKNAGGRNVTAGEIFGSQLFIRSLSVTSAQTNIVTIIQTAN
jgi:hypothetical protein